MQIIILFPRSTLEDHKKAAHNEGRREFGCDLCGVQFAVKAYLTKHMVRECYSCNRVAAVVTTVV